MGWFMRSELKKLPVLNIGDIDVKLLVSESGSPKAIRFAMAHPDRCSTKFSSLPEIDAYCSAKIQGPRRDAYYGGDPRSIGAHFEKIFDWALNVGEGSVCYDSSKGPFLVLRCRNDYRITHKIDGGGIYYHIWSPKELVVRTGQSTWRVYDFHFEGHWDIEE